MNAMGSKVENGLCRLLQITFESTGYDNELAAMLAGEYIRRIAVMSEQQKFALSSPFLSRYPLSVISIEGQASKQAIEEFHSTAGSRIKNAYLRRACECYLQWCEGIDVGDAIATKHPDVFEPLIRLIELGGAFGFHHGELLVGVSAIPLRDWNRFLEAEPFPLSPK